MEAGKIITATQPHALFNTHPGTRAWFEIYQCAVPPQVRPLFVAISDFFGLATRKSFSPSRGTSATLVFLSLLSRSRKLTGLLRDHQPFSIHFRHHNQPVMCIIPATAPTKRQRQVMRVQITGHHPWSPQKDWSRLAGIVTKTTPCFQARVVSAIFAGLERRMNLEPMVEQKTQAHWTKKQRSDTKITRQATKDNTWIHLGWTYRLQQHFRNGWWDSPKLSLLKIT